MITTTYRHKKENRKKLRFPMDDLVVGDIVHLSAGDMIPADVRILDAKDLFISQASLTGESEPVEKTPKVCAQKESITDYSNIAFMGGNVISGSATAVVVCTGDRALFGSMASAIAGEAVETSFTKRRECSVMGSDPVYAGHGSAGIFYQWYHKGRLAGCLSVRYFRGCRTDSGDAADDRNNLSCKRCRFHE